MIDAVSGSIDYGDAAPVAGSDTVYDGPTEDSLPARQDSKAETWGTDPEYYDEVPDVLADDDTGPDTGRGASLEHGMDDELPTRQDAKAETWGSDPEYYDENDLTTDYDEVLELGEPRSEQAADGQSLQFDDQSDTGDDGLPEMPGESAESQSDAGRLNGIGESGAVDETTAADFGTDLAAKDERAAQVVERLDPEHGRDSQQPGCGADQPPVSDLAQAQQDGQRIGDRYGVSVDYTSAPIDPRCAEAINDGLGRLSAEYPRTFGDMNVIRSQSDSGVSEAFGGAPGVRAYAIMDPRNQECGITFNQALHRDKEKADKQLAAEVKHGFKVPGRETVTGTAYHEFGHHLAQQIFDNPSWRGELNKEVGKITGTEYDAAGRSHTLAERAAIGSALSQYGASSPHEMVAEAFAEYKLAPQPREFSRAIGKLIDRHLKG